MSELTNMGKGLNHLVRLDLLDADSVVVDAGGGRGQFIDKFRTYDQARKCEIISLECNTTNLEIMRSRNYENVQLLEYALVGEGYGPYVEFTEFVGEDGKFHQWGNIYSLQENKAKKRPELLKIEKYKVPTITLAGLFDKFNLDHIGYLKMDVEGAEYDIVMSLTESLPISQMSFEVHDLSQIPALLNKLQNLGYSTEVFEEEIYANEIADHVTGRR